MNHHAAEENISEHMITIHLKNIGVTDEQLKVMRFRPNCNNLPFDQWTFTWGPGTPLEAIPRIKDYCALKWLLLESPLPSRDRDDASRVISVAMATPIYHRGVDFSRTQRIRAQKPRGKINDDNVSIEQVIERLALSPEYRDETAKELWNHFFAELEENNFRPFDEPHLDPRRMAYLYKDKNGKSGKIRFGRFANIVSASRKNHATPANEIE
jgi:hypothetical protein